MSDEFESDGLGSFSLDQIGMQGGAFGGARLLKYVTDHFVTREGETIGPERELVALGLKKVIQKFVGKQLAAPPIIVPDGEKVPDIEAMNQAAPQEEWGIGLDGKPQGPYSLVLVLKLLDPLNMDRFAFVTSSKGGAIAIGDLSDKTKIMRRFRGPDIAPVVSCSTTAFRIARLNITRRRPDFKVVRWIKLGDAGGSLPAPEPKPLAAPTAAEKPAEKPAAVPKPVEPSAKPEAFASVTLAPASVALGPAVEEPTLAEEMGGDAVPF
jgi:hypothetical protein